RYCGALFTSIEEPPRRTACGKALSTPVLSCALMARHREEVMGEIGCKVGAKGTVEIMTVKNGRQIKVADLDPNGVSAFAAALLALVQAPSIKKVPPKDFPVLVPTRFGLQDAQQGKPPILVVEAGPAGIGLALSDPRSLGEALLAASADKALKQ
ncbi:MAG: hypothetical protein KJ052_12120, partial [Candidatus Hydrogenedentes bacterium]|nr:hypothetical protein [Candidatus Hydrogenedentota bacterium]